MKDPYAGLGAADPYEGLGIIEKKVGAAEDMGRAFLSGLRRGASGVADTVMQATPVAGIFGTMATAANLAEGLKGHPTTPAPLYSAFSKNALRSAYEPQTTAGEYARAVGENVPNALAPGGMVRRVANVVVPAVTGETASQATRAAGGGKRAQTAARIVGAGAGAVAASVNPRALLPTPAAAGEAAPTLAELAAAKTAAYKAVDDSGVRYTPQAFGSLMEATAQKLDAEGFHAGLHPKTALMMERIGASDRAVGGYSPTLTELDQLRQQIGRDVASSSDPGERRMGQLMRDQIDDFIENAGPEQLVGGDAATAGGLITKARDLNARVSKLRSLDQLDEKATDRAASTGTGGNGENAQRQNVRRFADKTKNLTADEKAAARRVVRGTPGGNALRQVGRLSPEGNGVMVGMHLLGALPSHGMSLPVAGAGFIARRVSDALTQRNVQALRDLIASGGEAAQEVTAQLAAPQFEDIRRQLADDLASTYAVGSAAIPFREPAEPSRP